MRGHGISIAVIAALGLIGGPSRAQEAEALPETPIGVTDARECGCPHFEFGRGLVAVGAIATAATVGFAVAYGVAYDSQREVEGRYRALWEQGAPERDLAGLRSDARRYNGQAEAFTVGVWVSASVGVVALGLGIAMMLTHPPETAPEAAQADPGISLTPLVGPGSVGLHARF